MSKILIMIRHAHRDASEPGRDNGLSAKGKHQVEKLVQYFHTHLKKDHEGRVPHFLCSPKKRCQETITPIADSLKTNVKINPLLTECSPFESGSELEQRIHTFIAEWKNKGDPLTVICSHGDWIPICVRALTGARIGIKKSGFAEIELIAGETFLTALIQKV